VSEIPVLPIWIFTILGSALSWGITQRMGSNSAPLFRDNLSVVSSKDEKSKKKMMK
jgi:hypothetical protein